MSGGSRENYGTNFNARQWRRIGKDTVVIDEDPSVDLDGILLTARESDQA